MARILQVSDVSVVYHSEYSSERLCEDHTLYIAVEHSKSPHSTV